MTDHALYRLQQRFGLSFPEAQAWAEDHLDAALIDWSIRQSIDSEDCSDRYSARARYRGRLGTHQVHLIVNPVLRTLITVFEDDRTIVGDRYIKRLDPPF